MFYRAFHGFGQAKFPYGGSVLGSSPFPILPSCLQKCCSIQKWSKLTQKSCFSNVNPWYFVVESSIKILNISSYFTDWRFGRWPWSDSRRLARSDRRVLQETWNQEDSFQAGLQSVHRAVYGDLLVSRRSAEVGRDRQQWNLPSRNVAAHGFARGCQRYCLGIVARKVCWLIYL